MNYEVFLQNRIFEVFGHPDPMTGYFQLEGEKFTTAFCKVAELLFPHKDHHERVGILRPLARDLSKYLSPLEKMLASFDLQSKVKIVGLHVPKEFRNGRFGFESRGYNLVLYGDQAFVPETPCNTCTVTSCEVAGTLCYNRCNPLALLELRKALKKAVDEVSRRAWSDWSLAVAVSEDGKKVVTNVDSVCMVMPDGQLRPIPKVMEWFREGRELLPRPENMGRVKTNNMEQALEEARKIIMEGTASAVYWGNCDYCGYVIASSLVPKSLL